MTISKNPRYNLNLIIQETGLKADTIRAWERRYQLPVPARSEGGHRLYSDHDLATLKWLVARQKEGIRISQAVKIWMELVNAGLDPFDQDKPQTRQADTLAQVDGELDTISGLQEKWIEYCLLFDEPHAEQVLSLAFAQFPLETVLTAIILPSLKKVGELWYDGEASVQQEHFIAEIAIKKIQTLITAAPNPVRTERLLIACAPGEQHTITLLILTLLLKHRGWEVIYLGANVPNDQMKNAIKEINPALAVLTASRLATAYNLLTTLNLLVENQIPAAYGGWIFEQIPDLTGIMPGEYLGQDIPEMVSKIEGLIDDEVPFTLPKPFPQKNLELAIRLEQIRPDLDKAMWTYFEEGHHSFDSAEIYESNLRLIEDITAALRLGDIKYLRVNLDWISGLITTRDPEAGELDEYIKIFKAELEGLLGADASLITAGLDN